MHFEIFPPLIPNNILTHTQTTSPHFTQEPHLFGRTARRDFPIKLSVDQFERVIAEIRKLLSAESCQVFKVDEDGAKYTVTLSMVDEAIHWMKRDAELDEQDEEPVVPPAKEEAKVEVKSEEPAPEVKVEIDGQKIEVVSATIIESGAAVEIPAPPMTPPAEIDASDLCEPTSQAAIDALASLPKAPPDPVEDVPAPVVEETKKKGKGKKSQE